MSARAALLALLLACASAAHAAPDRALFEWQQRPGAAVPRVVLRDEAGQDFPASRLFQGEPVILDLGYFHCPWLCGILRRDLLHALTASGLRAGRDYVLAAVSIDPHETLADASSAKAADLALSGNASGAAWHYLTGSSNAIAAISSAVGFRSEYDARFRQFLHPTGIVVLTGSGVVSGYLLGVGYSGGDLRTAVIRARDGGIAHAALPVLLLCFHYDPSTGRYTLAVIKLLRLFAVLTVATLAGLFVVLNRQRRGPAA